MDQKPLHPAPPSDIEPGHRCDGCSQHWTFDALAEIQHLWERVEPGGVMPSGECPDENCGALCSPLAGPVHDLAVAFDVLYDALGRLLAWEHATGGWDARCWTIASRLHQRRTPQQIAAWEHRRVRLLARANTRRKHTNE